LLVLVIAGTSNAQPFEPGGFSPPDDAYDWIRLASGEWLKGKLIGLIDDKVEFDSEILGELYIDIEDVIGIHSRRTFAVTSRGEELVTGQIALQDEKILVDTGKGRPPYRSKTWWRSPLRPSVAERDGPVISASASTCARETRSGWSTT
jgi:hypothetical protein